MRVLLIPVGSAGDVHPHVGLGIALRARGHDVSVVTNQHFETVVSEAGLRLIPWGTADQFDDITKHPDLWHREKGIQIIAAMLRLGMSDLSRIIDEEASRGPCTLVAHSLAFAARVAHEQHGIPLVTLHLQPSSFHSVHDAPILHPWLRSVNTLPLELKKLVMALVDRVADREFAPVVNELLLRHRLGPVRQITSRWWHSPQQVIGLFPEWFAPPQPDWPTQTAVTGFPLFDGDRGGHLPTGIQSFLDAGSPPIVFLPGSANRQARRFFSAAVDACRQLNRRAILLSRYPEHLPSPLPSDMLHADYVPLGCLLPSAAALVHHGGIGTAAQGLAHALPQLVMPMTFDQPDNANRLERLGVARTVWPRTFRGIEVADALRELLESNQVRDRCKAHAAAIRADGPIAMTRTCELIERAEA